MVNIDAEDPKTCFYVELYDSDPSDIFCRSTQHIWETTLLKSEDIGLAQSAVSYGGKCIVGDATPQTRPKTEASFILKLQKLSSTVWGVSLLLWSRL